MADSAQVALGRTRVLLAAACLAVAALVASNLATVIHAGFHQALHDTLARVAATLSADAAKRMMDDSPRNRQVRAIRMATADLHRRLGVAEGDSARLRDVASALDRETKRLKEDVRRVEDLHSKTVSKATKVASSVRGRLVSSVRRGVGALAGEAIPVAGVALSVAVTAVDVIQACESMKELRDLLDAPTGAAKDEERVCGTKVPSQRQLLSALPAKWQSSWEETARDLRALSGPSMALPEVPTGAQVARTLCAIPGFQQVC